MMSNTMTQQERAALAILQSCGGDMIEAAILAREACAAGRGRLCRGRECIRLGQEALRAQRQTVTFRRAVAEALQERADRRPRTLWDFRYVCRRLMRCNAGWGERRLRGLSAEDCRRALCVAFGSPQQFRKGRAVLSAVFATALRRGWCAANPVANIELPRLCEQRKPILSAEEMQRLMRAARGYRGGCCLPAVGVMLYAGVRPHEVMRLRWGELDLRAGCISILPQHSKTGGARRVSICPPLLRLLQSCRRPDEEKLCPPCWARHWRAVRVSAGWDPQHNPWCPDVLRHTFASYHLCHFRDYSLLQWELGHRDAALLRTRYVDMRGVAEPARFWNEGVDK